MLKRIPVHRKRGVRFHRHSADGDRTSTQAGAAYILTLTMVLVVTLVFAAVLPFTSSHLQLAEADESYTDALYLAEAGINYEINKMNRSTNAGQYPPEHDAQPRTVTMGTGRSFTASATQTEYGGFTIQSTGNSAGITRALTVKSEGQPVFNSGPAGGWTLFGLSTLVLNGYLTVNDGLPVGTRGTATIDTSRVVINSPFYLIGTSATATSPYNTGRRFMSEAYPTVDALAGSLASVLSGTSVLPANGMAWLALNNDNLNIVNNLGLPVVLAANSTINSTVFSSVPKDASGFYNIILKNPYTTGRAANFYVEGIAATGGLNILVIDNTNGPVNLWIGRWNLLNEADADDSAPSITLETGNVKLKVADHSQFRIYVAATYREFNLKLDRNTYYNGDIYAMNYNSYGTLKGTIDIERRDNLGFVTGSLVGNRVNRYGAVATTYCPAVKGPRARVGEPIAFYARTQTMAEVK